jgi:N-methylhydantoinase A/oxoprolinase/acetone carboxylase beta subunit
LPISPAGTDAMPKPYRQRKVAIGGAATGIPAFLRAELKTGDRIAGPAAIEEASSDMVIPHGWAAQVDAEQNLIVEAV